MADKVVSRQVRDVLLTATHVRRMFPILANTFGHAGAPSIDTTTDTTTAHVSNSSSWKGHSHLELYIDRPHGSRRVMDRRCFKWTPYAVATKYSLEHTACFSLPTSGGLQKVRDHVENHELQPPGASPSSTFQSVASLLPPS